MRAFGLWLVLPVVLLVACGRAATPASFGTASPASPARLGSPPPPVSADPRLLSNTNGSFSFRHPKNWSFINCEGSDFSVPFAEQVDRAGGGICWLESGNFTMLVMSLSGDQRSAPAQGNYISVRTIDKVTTASVDGVEGTRTSAHVDSDPARMGPEAGTTQTLYNVYNGSRTYLALYQHRPSKSDETAAFDDLMQHTFRFSGWRGYHSEKWGYTIDYPASWFDLGNLGAPDTEKYFANRKDIGSPMGMGADGVLFSLSRLTGQCRAAPPGNVDGAAQLTVDGQAVTRITGLLGPPQQERFWSAYTAIPKGADCFALWFNFGSKGARDANLRTVDQVITSFTTS